ncbi:glycosyltransferase [[Pseudomonas] boreopolis]|uniref:glycosyltransferase n=1 Tax=Xanthomonas boreopolis TaxID=86183 RepID=UPI003D9FBD7F
MPESATMAQREGPVVIITLGTQGDIRPLLALARGLQRQGQAVRILTSANFAGMIASHGIEFRPLTGDFQALLGGDRSIAERGLDMGAMLRVFRAQMSAWARDWAEQGRAACADAGLILGTGSASLLAAALGEVYAIPVAFTQLQPLTPSRHLPPVALAGKRLPGLLNAGAYQLLRLLAWQAMRPAIDGIVRPQLGLRPYPWYGPYFSRPESMRVLYGYSEQVLPRPRDWPASVQVCGYWQLRDAQWTPPPALQAFLDAGEPPVYVGFGSMTSRDADALTSVVTEAVRACGVRAVLASGWGGLSATSPADPQVLHIDHAPHDWLFPRMAVAVHHGGAGTTGAAAAAGIPSVVVPFYGDQPFWAHCLAQRGVAPPALERRKLDAPALAIALRQALRSGMREAARQLGERIRAEDGVATAIGHLQRWNLLPARQPQEAASPAEIDASAQPA